VLAIERYAFNSTTHEGAFDTTLRKEPSRRVWKNCKHHRTR